MLASDAGGTGLIIGDTFHIDQDKFIVLQPLCYHTFTNDEKDAVPVGQGLYGPWHPEVSQLAREAGVQAYACILFSHARVGWEKATNTQAVSIPVSVVSKYAVIVLCVFSHRKRFLPRQARDTILVLTTAAYTSVLGLR